MSVRKIVFYLEFSQEWMIYRSRLTFSQEKDLIKNIKKRVNHWQGIMDIIIFNRKGKILKINYDPNLKN